ncbi:digestive cysteine proteinase 2-like [Sycon ciliatum]|uniref:digestive cysteine proteinase 2-like n=1 Tax=Sycon ciliatum TaxID=27933 RepID=UPI0031F6D37B
MWASVAVLCLAMAAANSQEIPKAPSMYYASGTISLPYAEIVEPYEAYIDGVGDRSRIDTYGGLASQYQLGHAPGPYGSISKVVYETTETVVNKRACLQVNGSAGGPVHFQPVLPRNLDQFVFTGEVQAGERFCTKTGLASSACNVFTYEASQLGRTNTYTLYLRQTTDFQPVAFHYLGFNRLFGSHYDEYVVTYERFVSHNSTSFPGKVFVPEALVAPCTGFPDNSASVTRPTGVFSRLHTMDEPDVDEIEKSFSDFKAKHGKVYTSDKEHFERSRIYRANHHYVESMNRRKLTYRMKLNHLADLTSGERRMMRGRKRSAESISPPGAQVFKPANANVQIPEAHDWRIAGAVTPVKDQAICGSCWSFSTTGAIESAYFLKYGKQVLLSQQNLMDCSWGYGNNACDGGLQYEAYEWIVKHAGIATAESYGPYLMQDGKCHKVRTPLVTIKSYAHTAPSNVSDAILALLQQPLAVSIDASHQSFGFYSHGVYYEPECGNQPMDLDHAVLAVGFGTLGGEDYWIVKNSWSTHWGNDGFVLMSRKDNNCGVATDATLVHL